MVSNICIDYSDNYSQECELDFIKKYIDKKIFVLDYDHTIKLHNLSSEMQHNYEKKLYDIFYKLKKHYNKKIYLVSYNLRPKFNDEYKDLFEEIYIPKPTKYEEFYFLQKELKCGYVSTSNYYYRYIPKYIQIKEIADKNNVHLSNIVFFDDNVDQITHASIHGIQSVIVNPSKGIEI